MPNTIQINQLLKRKKLNGFIVTNPVNIFYLTGFKGVSLTEREAILIFSPRPTLITARLYQSEAQELKSNNLAIKIVDERKQIQDSIQKLLEKSKIVGFEENDLKYSEFKEFKKILKKSKLISTKKLVEDIRIIKSQDEIKYIEKAQKISQTAFDQVIKTIRIGQTEEEIAQKLEKIIKNLGAQNLAFDSIVASGSNSALPHYVTGKRKIKKGDVLLFDFGAKYRNYCADLSRTIFIGSANNQQRNIYTNVSNAQKKAIRAIKQGMPSKKPYQTVYDSFKAKRLHKHFLHSLGHGIGLEVHERPSVGKKSKDKLEEGMVFSVEPGLYFPAWGGVRIEDLVTIKNGKSKVLGRSSEYIEIS